MYQSDEITRFLVKGCKHPIADLTFLKSGMDFGDWNAKARQFVQDRLMYEPERIDFAPQVVEEEDFGSYTRKKLLYYTAPDCRVSAYLLCPKNLKGPAPAILALHDHSGRFYYGKEKIVDHKKTPPFVEWFQKFRYGCRGFASYLAEQGYVVLCPDTLGWGDRRFLDISWLGAHRTDLAAYEEESDAYLLEFDKIWASCESRLLEAINFFGATYMGIVSWDDRRSLHYLASLPEVDESRLGCVGLSLGGYRTAFVGAMEEMVRCTCIVGYMTKFEDLAPKRCPGGWGVPGLYNRLPYPDLVSLVAPRPLMLLNCENDGLFDLTTVDAACASVRAVYENIGQADQFVAKGFPVGHQFGLEMQEVAFSWFDSHLHPGE